METVYAIVVTFSPNLTKLKNQKDALINQVDGIIYVDNGSKEQNKIRHEVSQDCVFLGQSTNLGIATAQNIGIQAAIEKGATHILLMDQDSIPEYNMVKELINHIKQDSKLACVGPKIINGFNPDQIYCGIKIKGCYVHKYPVTENPIDVSYCIASGSLIPIDIIADVGLMKDEMFIDGVDLEWGLRAKSMGYNIQIIPHATLIHELGNGKSNIILSHSSTREYYIIRNNLILMRFNYIPMGYKFRKLIFNFGRIAKSLFLNDKSYFKKAMAGTKDGLRYLFSGSNLNLQNK